MSLFDIILIVIVAGFGLFGLWFGLVHTLGSLIGTVFGVYLASRYYGPVAEWLIRATGWGKCFPRVNFRYFLYNYQPIGRLGILGSG